MHSRDIDARQWDDFIRKSPQGSIYALHAYLCIINPHWQAWIVSENGNWQAVMPWFTKNLFGLISSYQPALCQHQGPILLPFQTGLYRQMEWQGKVLGLLAEAIKQSCTKYQSSFSYSLHYLLPFYWQGFKLKPRYTFYLNLPANIKQFSPHHQRAIKKAQTAGLICNHTNDVQVLERVFIQKGKNKGFEVSHGTFQKIHRIYTAFSSSQEAFTFECSDAAGDTQAAMLCYAFGNTFIYYFGVVNDAGKKNQAMTLLMSFAMDFATTKGYTIFDFEGSMLQSVEKFFRGFGASFRMFFEVEKPLLG